MFKKIITAIIVGVVTGFAVYLVGFILLLIPVVAPIGGLVESIAPVAGVIAGIWWYLTGRTAL